ncbi:MAG: SDR family NAD(P)-dependent oxidoreductase [Gammaproteobacteria bacterium]
MRESLQGKAALITGATSGIGKSIALMLSKLGMDLCLVGRDGRKLDQLKQQLHSNGQTNNFFQCDLSSIDAIQQLVTNVEQADVQLDVLIHCAAEIVIKSIEDTEASDLDGQYFTNIRAPYMLSKLLLPNLVKQKGQVVFVNSSAALQKARANLVAYTATKYALVAIADGLRDEINNLGVRVISIYPGRTATPMQEEIYRFENREYEQASLLQPADVSMLIVDAITVPRTAEVTDISVRPYNKN